MGGDAIGMSTVLEAIAARHMGLNILGLSCLTNKNLPDCMQETSVEEIIARAEATGHDLGRLLDAIIPRLEE
jgi:purine-nucleoside phosphorylase